MDTDGDGIITLQDVNRPPNLGVYNSVLGRAPDEPILLQVLLTPEEVGGPQTCGLWEDQIDNDMNGHTDDIAGWDFVVVRNVPVSRVPFGGGGAIDGSGHGHQVTGVLAAANNELSVFEQERLASDYVGQTWRVRILPVRTHPEGAPVAGRSPFGEQGVIHDGLAYAVELGADVINMSFTTGCAEPSDRVPRNLHCSEDEFEAKLADIRRSYDVAGLDRPLLVVGPVNAPVDLDADEIQDLPAELRLPNQINVGSVDRNDKYRSDVVSWGEDTYHIAAPSESIPVLNFGGVGMFSDGIDNERLAGNSLAAPQVAGAAALVLSVSPGLRGNSVGLRDRILRNAVTLDALDGKVEDGRRLDVGRAVANAVP